MYTLADAYRAARQRTRSASFALTSARKFLADVPAAEARVTAAREAAAAVVDKRRYAPENVKAQDELRAATAALSQLRRILTPRGKGDKSMALNAPFAIGGYESAPGQWCENPPFRFVGLASEVVRLDHTGWYTDDFQDETARGVVYQATARDGRARYIPGIADPCNSAKDGSGPAVLAIGDMETATDSSEDASEEARRDAARRADQLAEYYAEAEREYQEVWQLGNRYAELGDEITETRRELLAALGERRRAMADAAVADGEYFKLCDMLRRTVRDMLERITEAREERRKILDDHWFRGDTAAAFNDGAGASIV